MVTEGNIRCGSVSGGRSCVRKRGRWDCPAGPPPEGAQFNAANATALAGAQKINNGSDNLLLDAFVDPTLGCTPMEAPDLSQPGQTGTSQALDELSANSNQGRPDRPGARERRDGPDQQRLQRGQD